MKLMTLVLFLLSTTACSSFSRHAHSGYAGEDLSISRSSVKQFYNDRNNLSQNVAKEELGLSLSKSLNEIEANNLKLRLYLKRLENGLTTQRERKQYYHYKPMLKNDAARIQFLKIPTVQARERFAQIKSLAEDYNEFDNFTLKMIEDNDISLGMNPQAVRESWGDPDMVEVAGREIYGNQAWKYTKMVTSEEGYRKETRVIYFESGKVIGWEAL